MPSNPPDQAGGPPHQEEVGAWMARYGPALRRYFQKKVNATEAEDLVQNVFLNIQVRGQGAGSIDNIEGYLFRTAANVLARRLGRDAWDPAAWPEGLEPRDEISPERSLLAKQDLERVAAALKTLPPRASQAFVLHRFEEMTYVAIAQRMGISTISVGKLIKRALRRLNDALEARS